MTTPTFITGFEHGIISAQGGGIATALSGVPTIEASIVKSGNYSMKIVSVGSGAVNFRKNTTGGAVQIAVARGYFRIPTGGLPSATASLFAWQATTAAVSIGMSITNTGSIRGVVGSGSSITGPDVALDTWHRIELRVNITGTTWTLDWSVDGVAQTQAIWSSQATNDSLTYLRLGSASSTLTLTMYFDDIVCSETSADYPIGPGGTELLKPNGSDTSNPGTNVMEEANGTDAGANAYLALNSVPMGNSTNYIKQVATGNTNYVGVTLDNIVATHSAIIGAMAVLSYTSATTTTNKGGCIVSKDAFSSFSVIWGQQSSTADYSDGSTASPYWKSVIVAGVIDDSTVNALSVRLGYSDDANPVPYWLDVGVEVAYDTTVVTEYNLDLVTYSSTANDITVLENVVESLDLVTYSSTINDISVVENADISLDMVTYSSTINDISLLENVLVSLDLVTYSSTINDLSTFENVFESLDLVTYSSAINDITTFENVFVLLDLVTYSSTINDVSLLQEGDIDLDLIIYSSVMNDIMVLENVIESLDMVTYSSSIYDIQVLEEESTMLDLVSFSSVFNDILLINDDIAVTTPSKRIYQIEAVYRIVNIERQIRTFSIEKQNRIV